MKKTTLLKKILTSNSWRQVNHFTHHFWHQTILLKIRMPAIKSIMILTKLNKTLIFIWKLIAYIWSNMIKFMATLFLKMIVWYSYLSIWSIWRMKKEISIDFRNLIIIILSKVCLSRIWVSMKLLLTIWTLLKSIKCFLLMRKLWILIMSFRRSITSMTGFYRLFYPL